MTQLTPSGHMPLEAHEAHLRNWSEMYAMEVPDDGREPQEQQPFERESESQPWLVRLTIAVLLVVIAACGVIIATDRNDQPTNCVIRLKGMA